MWENIVEQGRATDDNKAHAHCMLDSKGYKNKHKMCNTDCFSTAKMVARKIFIVTLLVHCLEI